MNKNTKKTSNLSFSTRLPKDANTAMPLYLLKTGALNGGKTKGCIDENKIVLPYSRFLLVFHTLQLPVDCYEIKGFRVKFAANPMKKLIVHVVFRVTDCFEKIYITTSSAHIFGGTGTIAIQADWQGGLGVGIKHFF